MNRLRLLGYLFIFCTIFAAQPAHAQQDPELEVGMKPFGVYNGGNIDTVSLYNGQLSLDIPLISYPQVGGKLKLEFHLRYANVGSQAVYGVIPYPPYGQFTYFESLQPQGFCKGLGLADGWLCHGFAVVDEQSVGYFITETGSIPLGQQTETSYSAMLMMPDGATHNIFPTCGACLPPVWESTDATSFQFLDCFPLSGCSAATTVIDSTGVNYVFPNSGQAYRHDTNGNTIAYSGSGVGRTDTMGRVIPSIPAPTSNVTGCPQPPSVPYAPSTATTWNPPGVNGGSYPILFCYIQLSETNPIAWEQNGGPWQPLTYTGTELQSVVLPNGTSWTFEYTTDGNADLSEVIFPTGGTLSYGSWQNVAPPYTAYVDYNRAVGVRTLNPNDGVTPSSTWTYAYSGAGSITTVSSPRTSGTTPDDTVHTFGGLAGYETQVQYYQGSHSSGTLLKTTTTQYSYTSLPYCFGFLCSVNVVPSQTATIWPNGQQNKTAYTYDSGVQVYDPVWTGPPTTFSGGALASAIYGKVLTKSEYDYGNGAPPASSLRTTTNTYLALNNSSYLSANLLDLVSSVKVTDAGGTQRAYTTYSYDETNGSPSGVHGNLTSAHRWLNTNGTYLVTTNVYDSYGRITSTTDPNSNPPTTYGYLPYSCPSGTGYSGSGPTKVTNALGQSTYSCYDLTTGLLTSTTDPNNQTTSYQYDNLLRTTQINYPDGGQTTFSYPTTTEVDITEKMDNAGHNKTASLLVDGVGRKIRQIVSNGESTPYDQADTCYDGNGRVGFQSYAYQGNGFSTARVCSGAGDSFVYDALGRTKTVTHSDGSTVLTSYTGRATNVQDEGNGAQRVQRISQVDGLGRLKSVCEVTTTTLPVGITGSTTPAACSQDIAATGFLTTYSYDALDNLTSVAQSPLNSRSFVYDSLARLTSATNPESGTTTYTYDANGNVLTKRDARSITITFGYDSLNRLTGKTYSDSTPAVTYNYDQTSAMGIALTNTIGRKSSESTAGTNATGSIFSYDPMGRVLKNSQCTPQNCSGTPFPLVYTYDLLGDVATSTNGAGVTLTDAYKLNGSLSSTRLASVTSSLSDSNHPGTLFGYQNLAHYNAAGSLVSVTLGNNANETRTYDSRLRLTGITNGSLYALTIPTTGGYAPNSNILSATDSVNGTWAYAYDPFNRLCAANQSSTQPVCGQTALYTYDYDRFGNRWHQNGPHSSQLGFDANNRIVAGSGVSYDAAGNVIGDGSHTYAYDAEGRISQVDGGSTARYVYDAEGRRVRKTTSSGSVDFLYDLADHEITEINSSGGWNRGEVYAGGRHLATYFGGTTYFIHADWLGTERARSGVTGGPYETCTSLPFGDWLACSGGDPSPMHFTGKEHDYETNLENFGARYDASSMGRFMTPDWSANIEPVPYAKMDSPQSLNLYSYVQNNPMTRIDADGHDQLWYDSAGNPHSPFEASAYETPMSSTEKKIDIAILSVATTIFGLGELPALAEAATTTSATLKLAAAAVATSGAAVNATVNVASAATGENLTAATNAVSAITTPAGYVTTVATGSTSKGAVASDVQDAVKAIASPKDAARNPAGVVSTVQNLAKDVKSAIAGMSTSPPKPPPPPRPPKCALTPSAGCS